MSLAAAAPTRLSPALLRRPPPLATLLPRRPLSSSPPPSHPVDPIAHAKHLVRAHDPDAFLAAYFFPAGRPREAFWAYRALNLELATIAETATTPALGAIKLQWWKDVVRDIAAGAAPPAHPLAQALSLTSTAPTADLAAYYWTQLIDARMANLHKPPPSTLLQLLTSLSHSQTPLHYLSLALLCPPTAPNPPQQATQAIQHLSLSTGLVSLLQQTPAFARSGRLPAFPVDFRVAHGVTPDEVLRRGGGAKGVRDATFEVASRANDELVTSRREWADKGGGEGGKVPREWLPAFLPGIAAQSYLSRLERASFDPFAPALQRADWRLPAQVWWGVQRGRY